MASSRIRSPALTLSRPPKALLLGSPWPSTRAKRVLAALLRVGWTVKRQSGSHRTLSRDGWPDYVFAFHDSAEVGPRMLAKVAKKTGLTPADL